MFSDSDLSRERRTVKMTRPRTFIHIHLDLRSSGSALCRTDTCWTRSAGGSASSERHCRVLLRAFTQPPAADQQCWTRRRCREWPVGHADGGSGTSGALLPRSAPVNRGRPSSRQSDRILPVRDGHSISTSLRVRFAALGPGFDGESQFIFYAATPGAFVDLASDFGYALDTPAITASPSIRSADGTGRHGQDGGVRAARDGQGTRRSDGVRAVVLDADLPPLTTSSGLAGLDERSTINRALGVLIDQGHHPDGAHATLRRHAAAAGVEPHLRRAAAAARVSERAGSGPPGGHCQVPATQRSSAGRPSTRPVWAD